MTANQCRESVRHSERKVKDIQDYLWMEYLIPMFQRSYFYSGLTFKAQEVLMQPIEDMQSPLTNR